MVRQVEFSITDVDGKMYLVLTRQAVDTMKLICFESPELDAMSLVKFMEEMLDTVDEHNG